MIIYGHVSSLNSPVKFPVIGIRWRGGGTLMSESPSQIFAIQVTQKVCDDLFKAFGSLCRNSNVFYFEMCSRALSPSRFWKGKSFKRYFKFIDTYPIQERLQHIQVQELDNFEVFKAVHNS